MLATSQLSSAQSPACRLDLGTTFSAQVLAITSLKTVIARRCDRTSNQVMNMEHRGFRLPIQQTGHHVAEKQFWTVIEGSVKWCDYSCVFRPLQMMLSDLSRPPMRSGNGPRRGRAQRSGSPTGRQTT